MAAEPSVVSAGSTPLRPPGQFQFSVQTHIPSQCSHTLSWVLLTARQRFAAVAPTALCWGPRSPSGSNGPRPERRSVAFDHLGRAHLDGPQRSCWSHSQPGSKLGPEAAWRTARAWGSPCCLNVSGLPLHPPLSATL